ncbi:DUF1828 domain-containing protein [Lactobacillus sp. B4005]|uniref:DUF1828 domain-containing protein n=1 Tax=Lactobacillus sp. B4005 TaxID=2818031 RepID=UPI00226A6081|nr:DUF1828 domain-containing protein [Lactobacillus sp. B4005]MCX8722728.1 DUF1828 domain-containing protein [Lactobacillus sp. B4005]
MNQNFANESQQLKKAIGSWVQDQTQICQIADNAWEIVTFVQDAMGESIYCFVEQKDDYFRVGDDGRTLFKIDPSASDQNLLDSAEELILADGFEYDANTGEIWAQADEESLVAVIMELVQLAAAISYLS